MNITTAHTPRTLVMLRSMTGKAVHIEGALGETLCDGVGASRGNRQWFSAGKMLLIGIVLYYLMVMGSSIMFGDMIQSATETVASS